jgi:hypothetical protein
MHQELRALTLPEMASESKKLGSPAFPQDLLLKILS